MASEIDCLCERDDCWYSLYSPNLLECFELLRYDLGGIPLKINSGFRCTYHNDSPEISGARNSSHKIGLALDIKIPEHVNDIEFIKRCKIHFDFVKYYKHGKYVHVHNGLTE